MKSSNESGQLVSGVFQLSEGTYTVDASKVFIPYDASIDKLEDRPASLVVDIVPFLVRTKNDLIVIDPGLGFSQKEVEKDFSGDDDFQIHINILKAGFKSDEVTMVLLSHLHKDHASGICYGKEGVYNLMFPNAKYFCQERELQYAFTKTNSPSYLLDRLEYLRMSPNLNLLKGNGSIIPGLQYKVTGGHTPNHQVFFIELNDKKFFFGGDVVPQPSQIIRKFIAKYDYEGKESARLRQQYARQGAEESWTFMFFHDARMPLAKLIRSENHYTLQKETA